MDKTPILIAEDDRMFRVLLEGWLQDRGYEVTVAQNGQQAWELLEREDAPKLVILDWMMPGITGPEICRRLRASGNADYRYVLLLTARSEKQDVAEGLESGADDYLSKPFDALELHARLKVGRRILDLHRELLRAQEALRFEATHDGLTGVWNGAAILQALDREVGRAERMGTELGLMMLDLDNFKQVNDRRGHLVGNEVLRAAARRIGEGVRTYDLVGRYGGEEFLVLTPGCVPPMLGQQAERIRAAIAEPINSSAGIITISASIGVVGTKSGARPALDARALVRAADEAMYRAKAKGKNRVEEGIVEEVGVGS
ncbi:MAG TPA: diguanylate cyclase [Terriglobales bacterium]|nr:diguanylate cyclase [Terriglobales bacterium]